MTKVTSWIRAARLRTLPLAFSCIFMGAFLAYSKGAFDGRILLWSVLTTLFLQILSNFANDYGDANSGVDGDQREGPKRMVSSGRISRQEMKVAMAIAVTASLVSGIRLILLVFHQEWLEIAVFLLMGMSAIVAAIKYTIGKNPYGYAGMGDLFVLLFFGFVGVSGSYFLYTRSFDLMILLPSLSCGLFAMGVLNVNNIRDIESDRTSGKMSIPVRLGRSHAIKYHYFLLGMGLCSALVYVLWQGPQNWTAYAFLLVVPLLVVNARAVNKYTTAEALDPYLRQLALTTLLFVLLFGLGQVGI